MLHVTRKEYMNGIITMKQGDFLEMQLREPLLEFQLISRGKYEQNQQRLLVSPCMHKKIPKKSKFSFAQSSTNIHSP